MSPILGIMASQGAGTRGSSFESIQTITVGSGGSSAITFTSIPQTYAHLQLRGIVRTNRTGGDDTVSMRFNSDTASNYADHVNYGNGATAAAYAETTQTRITIFGEVYSSTQAPNVFAPAVVDILDYASTNKYKTIRSINGAEGGSATTATSSQIRLHSGLWFNSTITGITSITIFSDYGTLVSEYSTIALYGIRAA